MSLPSVLLHDHLDGGLRPRTVLGLAEAGGYRGLPADNDQHAVGLLYREDVIAPAYAAAGANPDPVWT